jgi:hypothetical protein
MDGRELVMTYELNVNLLLVSFIKFAVLQDAV